MLRPGTLEAGTMFATDFRVLRPLGEGGMGSVYVVEQLSTGCERALKVMHEHLVRDEKLRGRFVQEARVGARIRSDHVVQVIAAGIQEESGAPWLVMELLEGRDLACYVRELGALPIDKVREICRQLCHALASAHQVGVVHRDLKPENVFLAESRREGTPFTVKVLDFGIAKILSEAMPSTTTTAIGTPLWMAPEQTDISAAIGPGCDVWALGLMAFWMLTGKLFWRVANRDEPNAMALMREVVFEPLPEASVRAAELGVADRLPAGFDEWFARCVIRETQLRFRDAGEARPGLVTLLGGDPNLAGTGPVFVQQPVAQGDAQPHVAITPPGGTRPSDIVTAPTELVVPAVAPETMTGPAVSESLIPPTVDGFRPRRTRALLAWTIGAVVAMAVVLGFVTRKGTSPSAKAQARCEKGSARDCANLGLEQEQLRTSRSLERALQYYQRACDFGDGPSCSRTGSMLQANDGIPRDDLRAAAAFDKACSVGEAAACRLLGAMYERGDGVTKSESRAILLYVNACDHGQAEACTRAGEMFREGRGAVPDPERAKELFARGCFGRDKRACEQLGTRN